MEEVRLRPEMTFDDLVTKLSEAANVDDPFEAWILNELATMTALASEHHAGCEHHVAALTLNRVLERYRASKS